MLEDLVDVPEAGDGPSDQDLPQVFVSYSRRDDVTVRAIADRLPSHGWRAWVDATNIPETAEWWQEIVDAIRDSEAFAFLITPSSVSSAECAKELEEAFATGKRIAPVLLLDAASIPKALGPIQWIDLRSIDGDDARAAKLAEALNVDLVWLKQHTWLLRRAHEWASRNRDRASVLRGADLEVAEQWLLLANSDRDPQPTDEQKAFLVASRKSAKRTRRRRSVAIGIALVVSLVLTSIAVVERQAELHQQHIAMSRELAADAVSQLDIDPELSLILAREAVRATTPATGAALEALRIALDSSHVRQRLRGITSTPNGIAVSPAGGPFGEDVAVASENGTLRLFDAATGLPIGGPIYQADGAQVTSVDFAPDGSRLLATMNVGNVGTAMIWTSPTDRQPITIETSGSKLGRVLSGALRSDGSVVLGGAHGAVTWRDGRTEPLPGPQTRVTAVAASDAATVIVFDTDVVSGAARFIPATGPASELPHGQASVTAVAVSNDGTQLLTGQSDGTTVLSSVSRSSAEPIATVRGHTGAVNAVAFSPNGRMFATGGVDGVATVRDTASRRELVVLRGHTAPITSLAFDPTIGRLTPAGSLVTGSADHTVRVWDVSSGERSVLSEFGLQVAQAATGGSDSIAIAALRSGTAAVWNVAHPDPNGAKEIRPDLGDLRAVAISPKTDAGGVLAILAGDDGLAAYRIRPAASGSGVEVTEDPGTFDPKDLPGRVNAVAFDPTGRYVVFGGSEGAIVRIDLDSGARTSYKEHGRVATVAVARDGEVAVGGRHGRVALWKGTTGSSPATVADLSGRVLALTFSPTDPKLLASSSTDSRAEIWNTRSKAQRALLLGHLGNVASLSFDARGDRLATASEDGTVRIWNLGGDLIAVIPLHAGAANSVAYRADDDLFASTILGHVAIYGCDLCAIGTKTGPLLRLAAQRITRSLDCNERLVFLGSCPSPSAGPSATSRSR